MTAERIVIAHHPRPLVSVLLVLYGRADLAVQAIADLVANTEPCFELIIVDNASPDDSFTTLQQCVDGAIFVSNPLNVGFGAGMNIGAMHARGEHLLLLNSDVFVEPDWLTPLVAALGLSPELAAVSPAFFHPDGTMQEAGSVIFRTGGTDAVAHGEAGCFDFPRTVPYSSAACLLIRPTVFSQLGGFDAVYGRGYFEDVDMALEIEALGWHIGYVPRSRARHERGGSTTRERALRVAEHNRKAFTHRWAHRLAHLPEPVAPSQTGPFLRSRDAFSVDRILIVDDRVPHIDRGSGDPRMA